jgi:hypothetical protein
MRINRLPASFLVVLSLTVSGFAQVPDKVDLSALAHARNLHLRQTPHDLTNGRAHARHGIFGIDSVPNFNGQFFAEGFDANGNPNRHWYTNIVGNPPQMGRTTTINAPIQPINIELDDVNGNLRFFMGNPLISPMTPFVTPILSSPVFSNASFTSSDEPTQYTDAIMRAEFFNKMKPDWHTLLAPSVLPAVTLHLSQSASCSSTFPFAGCNYLFVPNADNTCCLAILANAQPFVDQLFNIVFSDITSNSVTAADISNFLVPNTLLFVGDLTQCCIGGFHEYAYDPTVNPEPRWVFTYASWFSPDVIVNGADVLGISHELAETFNDPFVVSDGVHNLTPWWLAPNGQCQDDLEVGDVIEGLPNSEFPITVNGFTYHPQNVALIQWFEFQQTSDAIDGAFSYPDTTVLPGAPILQNPGCVP